jgi:hypothetical protein
MEPQHNIILEVDGVIVADDAIVYHNGDHAIAWINDTDPWIVEDDDGVLTDLGPKGSVVKAKMKEVHEEAKQAPGTFKLTGIDGFTDKPVTWTLKPRTVFAE